MPGALVTALLTAVGAVLLAAVARRLLHRVEVVGTSMAPTFLPGDRLLVLSYPLPLPLPLPRQPWPRPGTVVAVRDPRDPVRLLLKRVTVLHPADRTLEVVGDGPASTDSRAFGPVPLSSLVGRAVYRYAPPGRSSRGPWPTGYDRSR